ncbi:MAG: hypothetical protein JJ992_03850, partial [Planctomycetes bacterium]|nr:hypothetical protein [Planctomycetota bacterium]
MVHFLGSPDNKNVVMGFAMNLDDGIIFHHIQKETNGDLVLIVESLPRVGPAFLYRLGDNAAFIQKHLVPLADSSAYRADRSLVLEKTRTAQKVIPRDALDD